MPRFVDTSVIVRYLTNDDPPRARVAAEIIETSDLVVSGLILSETAFVLRSSYRYPWRDIIDALVQFVLRENIDVVDLPKDSVVAAFLKARDNARISLGDALIMAQMRASGHHEIYSFDTRFGDESITVLDKPAR